MLTRIIGFFTRSPPLLRPKPKSQPYATRAQMDSEDTAHGRNHGHGGHGGVSSHNRRRHPHARAAATAALATGGRLQFGAQGAQQQGEEQKENKPAAAAANQQQQ